MPNAKPALLINLLVMVLLSGLLLGWSMESVAIVVVTFAGALLGFVVCDWFKLFRIEGLLANVVTVSILCLLYTSPSPRDATLSRMPSSA